MFLVLGFLFARPMAMRKRKSTGISQSAGSAQASEASRDSGVSQPADTEGARILLVDAGWIRPQIVKDLVRDQRPRKRPGGSDERYLVATQTNHAAS